MTTADKDCSEYDGYTNVYCIAFFALTVEKVPSAQDLEEVITFNSWEEVFTVFGEENSYLIENKLNEIFIEKLLTEENLKVIFGNSITVEDVQNKKLDILKWSFTLTNNEISSVQMLVMRENINNTGNNRLQNATFVLNEMLNLSDISAKTNVHNEIIGEHIKSFKNAKGNYTVINFTDFANNLKVTSNGTSWDQRISYALADEEGIAIFNLLMPYAVNEKTTYSHVSVSYSSGLNNKIKIEIYVYNEKSNIYESWNFNVYRGDYEDDDFSYSLLQTLVKNGEVDCSSINNKQMLSGDIIFSLDNDDIVYYEINPIAQQ